MADEHPYPQLDLLRGSTPPGMTGRGNIWETISDAPPSDPLLPPYSLEPVIGMRESMVPGQPHEVRTPATLKYPKSREVRFLISGINNTEQMTGFSCRAIGVQNLGTNVFLFCRELNMYVTAGPVTFATYNLPEGHEKLTFEWHTAIGNAATPAGVAGQGAVVWLYDEWALPTVVVAGNIVSIAGTVPVSIAATVAVSIAANASATGTQSNVAQNAASTALLAANANRKGASIVNDSASILYVSFSGAASLTNYKVAIPPLINGIPGYYELAPESIFTGQILGIWAAAGAGAARVTELT